MVGHGISANFCRSAKAVSIIFSKTDASECKIVVYVFVKVFSQFRGVLDQTESIYFLLEELAEEKNEA